MYAFHVLLPTLRSAEAAVFHLAGLIEACVTESKWDRRAMRKACDRAHRRMMVAVQIARGVVAESGPASSDAFRECLGALEEASGQLATATDAPWFTRFKRNERAAMACAALVCSMVALRQAKQRARRGVRAAKADPQQIVAWTRAQFAHRPQLAS